MWTEQTSTATTTTDCEVMCFVLLKKQNQQFLNLSDAKETRCLQHVVTLKTADNWQNALSAGGSVSVHMTAKGPSLAVLF